MTVLIYAIIYIVVLLLGILLHPVIKKFWLANMSNDSFTLSLTYFIFCALMLVPFPLIREHERDQKIRELTKGDVDTEDVNNELFIGEWIFHDKMGTFKERILFCENDGKFYEVSYVPVDGWKERKEVHINKEGNLYVYSNKNDIYFIHPDGTMTWRCKGYADEVGNGTYYEGEMKIAYRLQR